MADAVNTPTPAGSHDDAGPTGRLVVKLTFLSFEDDEFGQPDVLIRSRTDSLLEIRNHNASLGYKPAELSGLPSTPTPSETEQLNATCEGSAEGSCVACAGSADSPRVASSDHAESPAAVSKPKREVGEERRTTLMMRNVPNDYTRKMLLELLEQRGFAGAYDFVYLPMDFDRGCGLGYAFVNLVDAALVPRFRKAFDGYKGWDVRSTKVCRVSWSDRDQGLRANVRRYRNSPVMHASVPDEYKPCRFSCGQRVPFPPPNKPVRPPGKKKV